eukprot:13363297-Heterocapsa_arctica.AAC.1
MAMYDLSFNIDLLYVGCRWMSQQGPQNFMGKVRISGAAVLCQMTTESIHKCWVRAETMN